MNEDQIVQLLILTLKGASPLIFAALGELIVEKSGVLNLGVEGMMLMGAVAGFIGAYEYGFVVGILFAVLAGVLMSLLFGVLTLSLVSNQVATGLALTIFGIGLSAFIGIPYEGKKLAGSIGLVVIPFLSDIPLLGPLLFKHDPLLYLSLILFGLVTWFLYRTRGGLILRAVGESHDAAHALGYSVIKLRYIAVAFGGAMAGLGGAYLSLVLTPGWEQDMTAQRGWIALALVVFATWRPARVLVGAWLFGGLTILNLWAQSQGIGLPQQLLTALPFLATIVVLVLISRDATMIRLNAPASLGKPFHPTS